MEKMKAWLREHYFWMVDHELEISTEMQGDNKTLWYHTIVCLEIENPRLMSTRLCHLNHLCQNMD